MDQSTGETLHSHDHIAKIEGEHGDMRRVEVDRELPPVADEESEGDDSAASEEHGFEGGEVVLIGVDEAEDPDGLG